MHIIDKLMSLQECVAGRAPNDRTRDRIEEIQFSDLCVEPGYDRDKIRAFGNWNKIDSEPDPIRDAYLQATGQTVPKVELSQIDNDNLLGRFATILEKRYKVELEWNDEWDECIVCLGRLRTNPNGYDWLPAYTHTEDGPVCIECLKEDFGSYAFEFEGNFRKAVPKGIDLAKYGYQLYLDDLQHGFHYGQDASPKVIATGLERKGIERYVFRLDSNSQFTTTFQCWIHEDDWAKREREPIAVDGPSVSAALAEFLRDAPVMIIHPSIGA